MTRKIRPYRPRFTPISPPAKDKATAMAALDYLELPESLLTEMRETIQSGTMVFRNAEPMPEHPESVQRFWTDASGVLDAIPSLSDVMAAPELRVAGYLRMLGSQAESASEAWQDAIRREDESRFGLPRVDEPERQAWQWIRRYAGGTVVFPVGKRCAEILVNPLTHSLAKIMPLGCTQQAAMVVPCERGFLAFLAEPVKLDVVCKYESFGTDIEWRCDPRADAVKVIGGRGSVSRVTLRRLQGWWRYQVTGQKGAGRPPGRADRSPSALVDTYTRYRRRFPDAKITRESFAAALFDGAGTINARLTKTHRALRSSNITFGELRDLLEHDGDVILAERD